MDHEKEKMRNNRKRNAVVIAIIFIGFTLYQIYTHDDSNVRLYFDEKQFTIRYQQENIQVPYSAVKQVTLEELPDTGTLIEGDKTKAYQFGVWENDVWGRYVLCIYRSSNKCMVIETENMRYVVNGDSDLASETMYGQFLDLLGKESISSETDR